MAGYKLIGRNKLIPRPTFVGRHRQYAKVDMNNPFENQGVEIEYEEFDVLECVVQPLTGKAARDYTSQLMQEGGGSTIPSQFIPLSCSVVRWKVPTNLLTRSSL